MIILTKKKLNDILEANRSEIIRQIADDFEFRYVKMLDKYLELNLTEALKGEVRKHVALSIGDISREFKSRYDDFEIKVDCELNTIKKLIAITMGNAESHCTTPENETAFDTISKRFNEVK